MWKPGNFLGQTSRVTLEASYPEATSHYQWPCNRKRRKRLGVELPTTFFSGRCKEYIPTEYGLFPCSGSKVAPLNRILKFPLKLVVSINLSYKWLSPEMIGVYHIFAYIIWLVVWNINFIFPLIFGMSSSQLTIFF